MHHSRKRIQHTPYMKEHCWGVIHELCQSVCTNYTLSQASLHHFPVRSTPFRLICKNKPSHVFDVSVYLSLIFQSAVGPAGPCGSKSLHRTRSVSKVLGGHYPQKNPKKNHDTLIEPVPKYAASRIATTYLYTLTSPSFFTVSLSEQPLSIRRCLLDGHTRDRLKMLSIVFPLLASI